MSHPKIKLTQQGLENLRDRAAKLERKLADITSQKTEAFQFSGNGWHENAPFEDLVERERLTTQELCEVRDILAAAHVVEIEPSEVVGIGAIVAVEHADGSMAEYSITDPFSVDIERRIVSYDSPIGRVLVGKRVGDEIQARPVGQLSKIVSIRYDVA